MRKSIIRMFAAGIAAVTLFTATGVPLNVKAKENNVTVNGVSNQVKKVKISRKGATIYKGKTLQLSAKVFTDGNADKSVLWKSSNSKIASVTQGGKVKGLKAGTTAIWAISKQNKKVRGKCKVTVLIDDSKNIKTTKYSLPVLEDRKNKKITTYKELQEYMKYLEKQKQEVRTSGAKERVTKILRDLKKYKKSYFKNNVLYIRQEIYPAEMGVKQVIKVERSAKSNGKYKLTFTLGTENTIAVAVMCEYVLVAECSKTIADDVTQVSVKYEYVMD